jgi:hypothetical protein
MGSSKSGSANPGPAGRLRGLFLYAWYDSHATSTMASIWLETLSKAGS